MTSMASTSLSESVFTRFTRNGRLLRTQQHGRRRVHTWQLSLIYRGHYNPERESTAVRGNPTLLWVRSLVHLHGITIRNTHLPLRNANWKWACGLFYSSKVYLISEISACCYISSSLHWLRPPFVFHHHAKVICPAYMWQQL